MMSSYTGPISISTDLASHTQNPTIPSYYHMCCADWTAHDMIQAFKVARTAIQQRTNVPNNHEHLVRNDTRWKWCDYSRGDEYDEREDMHDW